MTLPVIVFMSLSMLFPCTPLSSQLPESVSGIHENTTEYSKAAQSMNTLAASAVWHVFMPVPRKQSASRFSGKRIPKPGTVIRRSDWLKSFRQTIRNNQYRLNRPCMNM